jgi:hypothetical protein
VNPAPGSQSAAAGHPDHDRDAGAVTAAAVFAYKLATVKKRLEEAGVKGRRRPDQLK